MCHKRERIISRVLSRALHTCKHHFMERMSEPQCRSMNQLFEINAVLSGAAEGPADRRPADSIC